MKEKQLVGNKFKALKVKFRCLSANYDGKVSSKQIR